MNLLRTLTTRDVSLAVIFSLDRSAGPTATAGALIALPAQAALRGLRITHRTVSAFLPASENHRLGDCVDCGKPVTKSDPFIRYRGGYYHAHGCAELRPPALTQRQARST